MRIPIGIVGTGNVCPQYMKTLGSSRVVRIVGVADADPAAAARRAQEYGVPAMTLAELLDGDAAIVLNLTPPLVHHAIGLRVLQAGKHLYTEKPLAATFAQGAELLALAKKKRLRVGCAPDTFLGAGAQALRALADAGAAGTIRHGTATFMGHGPDDWHPHPAFFYQPGAGPMLDMGVYYVTHLVHLLGPVQSLRGRATVTHRQRTIPSGPNEGSRIAVKVPTHVVSHLRFTSGADVVLTASFDVWRHGHGPLELYGDDGTLLGHDPNRFGGTVRWAHRRGPWQRAPGGRPYTGNSRGIGVIDMALAIEQGREHRCSGALGLHVLEVLERAADPRLAGAEVRLTTRCTRPDPLEGRLA
jgi:predicted dehydrogenase